MTREARNSYQGLITAAIFIGLEIAALSMLSASSTIQDIWINRFSHRIMASLWSGGENVRNYFSLGTQNEALSKENMDLRRQLEQFRLAEEAAQEEAPEEVRGFRYTPATIVKMSRNNQRNYIILDKGSEDGVHPEDGIITSSGVVGIIDAVDKHYSYGMSFMNVNMKISSRVGRKGAVGPLSWDGKSTNRAFLHELPLHYEVSRGDTVFTSGYSTIFPPDIPLGVAGSTKMVNGSTNDLEVTLFQDFSSLKFVTIVENSGLEEIKALERQQNEEEED